MDIFDEAAGLGKSEKKVDAVNIEAHYRKDVLTPLEYVATNSPKWLKQIKDYTPTAQRVIDKVMESLFWRDLSVARLVDELSACTRNTVSLQEGLERLKRLNPQCVLNRSGKYDATIARGVANEICGLLGVGRGCADRMKELVSNIEDRIRYLMDHQGILPPSPDSPGGVEIEPPQAAPKSNVNVLPVNTAFNPRER